MEKDGANKLFLILLIVAIVLISFVFYKGITGNVVSGPESFGPSESDISCMMNCMGCSSPGVGCTGNQEQCMEKCNVVKPEQTEEESCVETCSLQGCDQYDFECQSKNQEKCDEQCGMIKEPEAKSEEEQCIRDCVNKESPGLICQAAEGGEQGNEICQKCAKQCEYLYEGPCLDEEKLEEKKQACKTCDNCYGEPVMGDSGEGYECITDITCKDSSSEFGDTPGTGEGVSKTEENEDNGNAITNVVESIGNFFKGLFGGNSE